MTSRWLLAPHAHQSQSEPNQPKHFRSWAQEKEMLTHTSIFSEHKLYQPCSWLGTMAAVESGRAVACRPPHPTRLQSEKSACHARANLRVVSATRRKLGDLCTANVKRQSVHVQKETDFESWEHKNSELLTDVFRPIRSVPAKTKTPEPRWLLYSVF